MTDRAIGLIDRFAACFRDFRCAELIEHEVKTLIVSPAGPDIEAGPGPPQP